MPRTNRLERLRTAQKLHRMEVALKLGVHERTIYRWEICESSIPEKHWEALSELFGVSVAYLLGIEDNGEPDGNGVKVAA